ncbi:Prolipoprotein diacylglyceryl transferase [Candidatus Ecksteinia adelgidicola]|nr:Prolipoprotein diacylglyceryl transferase [Candidatus Ecksteinia adelgidicola]
MNNNYLKFPNINPIFFSFGPICIHWYGLMYLISFIFSVYFASRPTYNLYNGYWTKNEIKSLLYNSFLGVLIGGRLGYVFFYNFSFFLNNPLYLFKVWNGGMSFHGGLIGVVVVIFFFSYYSRRPFFQISDFITPLIPFGLGCGRFGNFINGELWGRITINTPWAMLFPGSKKEDEMIATTNPTLLKLLHQYGVLPRHPSQLYELILEGLVLFTIIHLFIKKQRPIGAVSGIFLFTYGIFRIIIEIFRQPDIQIGLFNNYISMGQILSFPMVLVGMIIIVLTYIRNRKNN